jgi:ABC-2 type transport system ATP-binding protein
MQENKINQGYMQKLEEYIYSELKRGVRIEDIQKKLITIGWDEGIIKENIKKNFSETYYNQNLLRNKELEPNIQKSELKEDFLAKQTPIMQIKNISKRFGDTDILKNISLNIMQKEILGIIGISGSGKTTFMNLIVGFLKPDQGGVYFNKNNTKEYYSLEKNRRKLIDNFGYASQNPSFYRRLTVTENLNHYAGLFKIRKEDRKNRIKQLLQALNLENARNTKSKDLSGGMKRRLEIACALIHDPKILLMDEPTSDLDPIMRKEIENIIININKLGKTVIITTHLLSEAEHLCNKIAILHNKEIIAYGSAKELRKKYIDNDEVHLRLASNNYTYILNQLQNSNIPISKIIEKENKLVFYTPYAQYLLHKIVNIAQEKQDRILDIQLNNPTLNEIFSKIIKDNN